MATNQKSDLAKLKFKKFAIQHISTNFSGALGACHKIEVKKSSIVKNGESEQKYGIYLFKVETFLLKRHQVNVFLSTFQVHVLYF